METRIWSQPGFRIKMLSGVPGLHDSHTTGKGGNHYRIKCSGRGDKQLLYNGCADKYDVLVAKTVVSPNDCRVPLRRFNPLDEPVKLYCHSGAVMLEEAEASLAIHGDSDTITGGNEEPVHGTCFPVSSGSSEVGI